MLSVGGLFSGIGGWELGLERAGMRVLWHCEAEPFARAVLEHHWPDVPCYEDVCDLRGAGIAPVDVLCGGFPCQDLSLAGKGAGLDGERSGLWSEYARLVGELRPRYVLVENVSALLARGFGTVLGDLATLGYDAEWDCLPASAFGAPHGRDRVWLVAYRDLPDTAGVDGPARGGMGPRRVGRPSASARGLPGDALAALGAPEGPWAAGEPDVGRMAHGLPAQVDRLHGLGNALVPQIAEWIGRRILEHEAQGEQRAA